MQAALDKAETLVSMGDFYFLNNVWGAQSSGFRPVRELADKMNLFIREYYDSGDADETIRCLKELNVPHFFHEFVYELMDFCLEKNTERAQQLTINLLEILTKSAVITYDQLKTGMLRLFDDIEDIQLDVPNVYDQLQILLKQLGEKKILNQDITSNAPQKGRKRITSEGENNKQDKD
jgi:programmed cell death protein 4